MAPSNNYDSDISEDDDDVSDPDFIVDLENESLTEEYLDEVSRPPAAKKAKSE